MMIAPILSLPDFDEPFIVEADASGSGVGAILVQRHNPLAYFSHGFIDLEQRKPIYERELMAIVLAIRHWKHFLLRRRFIVRTDQKSLKYLLEQREVNMEYQRWLTKLLGYDFEIHYKPGLENKAEDGLSRIKSEKVSHQLMMAWLNVTVPTSLQQTELLAEIDSDKDLQLIIDRITQGEQVSKRLHLSNGRLFYKNQLVLPATSQFIPLILDECHDTKTAGHMGVLKTLKRVQSNFYWRGMKKVIQDYVAKCTLCQIDKYSTLSPAGLLQPLPIPERVWEDISVDFVEGLPVSKGYNVVLVVVDRLSKYGHFIPLKHPFIAVQVAGLFTQEIVRLHGFPRSIVSDRDRIFLSNFWRELFKLAGTKLNFSTAFHPQSDGQTEILNKGLEAYLHCYASDQPRRWAYFLAWAEFSYNTSFHTSLKATPFKVVYGREPPQLLHYEPNSSRNFDLDASLKERDLMLLDIKQHLQRAQNHMKMVADKKRRDVQFNVGDKVFLKLRPYRQQSVQHRSNHKLAARFFGPYMITEKIGKVAYRLALPPESRIHPVFHVSQLKKVIGDTPVQTDLPDTLRHSTDTELFPQHIRETRYDSKGRLEVLVQWEKTPPHDSTWVKAKDLNFLYPSFQLGDKLQSQGRGTVIPWRIYIRKKKRDDNDEMAQEGTTKRGELEGMENDVAGC